MLSVGADGSQRLAEHLRKTGILAGNRTLASSSWVERRQHRGRQDVVHTRAAPLWDS